MDFEKLKQAALEFHDKVTKTSPLERTLLDATSDENWSTPAKLLQEIADATYNYQDFSFVMKFLWERLMTQKNKSWQKVVKVLGIIEYLIKNGAPRCIGEFKDEIYQIKSLNDYQHIDKAIDRGEAIREKTKQIIELLNDEQRIEQVEQLKKKKNLLLIIQEREQAKKIREKLSGIFSQGSEGQGSKQQGGSNNKNPYQGYSAKNDRKEQSRNNAGDKGGFDEKAKDYDGYAFQGNLNKYRDKKEEKPVETKVEAVQTKPNTTNSTVNNNDKKIDEKKQPFQQTVLKIPKPGELGEIQITKPNNQQQTQQQQQSQQQQQQKQKPQVVQQQTSSLLDDFDEPKQEQVKAQQNQQQNDDEWSWGNDQQKQQQPVLPQQIQQQVQQQKQQQILQQQKPTQQQQTVSQQNFVLPNDIFMVKSPQQLQQQVQQYQINTNQSVQPVSNTVQPNYFQQQQQQQQQFPVQQQQFNQPQNFANNSLQQINWQQQQQNNLYQSNNQTVKPQQQQPQQSQQNNDDDFEDFQGLGSQKNTQLNQQQPAQQTKKVFSDFEMDLVNLSDLKKEQQSKPVNQKQQQQNINQVNVPQQSLLYTTQEDLDSFNISPNKQKGNPQNNFGGFNMNYNPQQQQFQQPPNQNNLYNMGTGQQQAPLQPGFNTNNNFNNFNYQQQPQQQYGGNFYQQQK